VSDAVIRFASESPWLTFFMFWILCWTVTVPFKLMWFAWNRYLRSKNIQAHGYPTNPLMDADGDIVLPKDKDAA